jgi:hypothetical protein
MRNKGDGHLGVVTFRTPGRCRLIIGEEATFPLAQFDQPGVIGAIESILDSWVSLKLAPAILAQMLGGG